MRVLDLGGEAHTWTGSDRRPREVTLLNIPWKAEEQAARLEGRPEGAWLKPVAGDACNPPEELLDQPFDLVYSNSVIEHVGGHQRRRAFAYYAQALGEHHWIQTPNRYFPLEPHWVCPGIHYLPPRARAAVTQVWPIGNYTHRRESLRQRMGDVLAVELLTASEMQYYFEASRIVRERVAGLAKSLIAVR
ncbi:MAG: hypothetical protein QOH76_2822 [Thermoleophilaceae bacterium]|nr:hypothetical protein [Thermoleophilaceae bacterium]